MACPSSPVRATTARTPSACTTGPRPTRLRPPAGSTPTIPIRHCPRTEPRRRRLRMPGTPSLTATSGSTCSMRRGPMEMSGPPTFTRLITTSTGRPHRPSTSGWPPTWPATRVPSRWRSGTSRSGPTTPARPATPLLQNTPSNPNSLEALLAANGVQLAFNGHAHIYERTTPANYQQNGELVNYVTGGGGGILEPVSATGSSACTGFTSTGSIYALGWSPTSNKGSACGTGVPTPQSYAQVFNYLQVSVEREPGHGHPDQRRRPVLRPADLHLLRRDLGAGHGHRHPAAGTDQRHHRLDQPSTPPAACHLHLQTRRGYAPPPAPARSPIPGWPQAATPFTVTGNGATPATATLDGRHRTAHRPDRPVGHRQSRPPRST